MRFKANATMWTEMGKNEAGAGERSHRKGGERPKETPASMRYQERDDCPLLPCDCQKLTVYSESRMQHRCSADHNYEAKK
jgi:hypothetical protein